MPELFGSVISFHGYYPKRIGRDEAPNACRKLAKALHTFLVIYTDSSNYRQYSQRPPPDGEISRGLPQDGIRMKTD